MPEQRNYHQNGGMFFSLNGGPIQEYESSDSDEMFELFETIIGTARVVNNIKHIKNIVL